MNANYLTTYGVGVPFPFLRDQGHAGHQAGGPQGSALPRPAELRRDVQALRHRRREHRGAGGLHRARARHGAGLWLAAVGHQRLRLGQAHQDQDRSGLLQRHRQRPDEQDPLRLARRRRSARCWTTRSSGSSRTTCATPTEKTKETLEQQAKAGIKVVDFGPEWRKTAVELSWEDLKKLSPDSIGKLQAVIDKAGK